MSSFDAISFPARIAANAVCEISFSVSIIETPINKSEQRIIHDDRARRVYKFDLELDSADQEELVSFFIGRLGQAYAFRFQDVNDYEVTDEPLENGTTGTIQLIKTYADDVRPYVRTIIKPKNNAAFKVRKNTVELAEGVDYTVDYTTGIVTLLAARLITDDFDWSGEFDVPVRFSAPLSLTRLAPHMFDVRQMELVEVFDA